MTVLRQPATLPEILKLVKIDIRSSHGYLRSCPFSFGEGRFTGLKCGNRLAKPVRIRVGSWNVGTLTGKRYELVETLRKCKVDILCVQETRWKGHRAAKIKDYKLWFSGSRVARNGVGIIIGPPYNENVVDVSRRSDRIMSVRLVIQEVTYTVISAYAPQAGLGEAEKRLFWDLLDEVVRMCPPDHRLLIGGDLNSHIGTEVEGYAEMSHTECVVEAWDEDIIVSGIGAVGGTGVAVAGTVVVVDAGYAAV
ncbi:uncharacterized protein [Rutidosis leptorrhynchoides]|uniref:uncharacterized protein n=1 Tax=Rutidosis leptorrhynchoides TaxID=125765 RepID=UPI003A9A6063